MPISRSEALSRLQQTLAVTLGTTGSPEERVSKADPMFPVDASRHLQPGEQVAAQSPLPDIIGHIKRTLGRGKKSAGPSPAPKPEGSEPPR